MDTDGYSLTLHSPLRGHAASFNKEGVGRLILTTPAEYAGNWIVQAGSLELHGAGALNPVSRLEVRTGARFDLSAADGTRQIRALDGGGTVSLGTHTLILAGGNGHFAGTIEGAGGLTIAGADSFLELSGSNAYTGPTTLLGATLRARPWSLSERVINHGRLELYEDGGLDAISAYSGNISGSGSLVKTGRSVIWLRGHNSHTGGTRIEAGVLMGNTDSLTGDIVTDAGLAFYQVADGTYAGRVSGSGALMSFGPGALTLTGENTHNGGTVFSNTLRVHSNANLGSTFSSLVMVGGTLTALQDMELSRKLILAREGGRIDTGGHHVGLTGWTEGEGGLVKNGSGTFTFAGQMDHRGVTEVAQGGMAIYGNLAGDLIVHAGAWLDIRGWVGGSLQVRPGGRLSAEAPGQLRVAGDLHAAGELLFEIGGPWPSFYDQILVGGRADLTGVTLSFVLLAGADTANLDGLGILSATGGITGLDTVTYRFGPGLEGYGVRLRGDTLYLAQGVTDAVVPVPEPGAWAMLLAGLGLVGWMSRRRRA